MPPRKHSCATGKRPYTSIFTAVDARLSAAQWKPELRWGIYKCMWCDQWHLTSHRGALDRLYWRAACITLDWTATKPQDSTRAEPQIPAVPETPTDSTPGRAPSPL